jgi:hypothetical protein
LGAFLLKKYWFWGVMNWYKTATIAICAGVAAVVIGLVAFTLSWNLWDFWGGPMPGLQVILFPGNLMLVYLWHPLFTEEVNFWPKLALLLLGQFGIVFFVVGLLVHIVKKSCLLIKTSPVVSVASQTFRYTEFKYPATGKNMNLDKAKKRIAKQVKKGFDGYPQISLAYFGRTADCATEVHVTFLAEAGAEPQVQKFSGTTDVRNDETIQSVLVKIIERAEPKTVTEVAGVTMLQ